MFDTHCHFNLDEFQNDLDFIINASLEKGVDRFLVPGLDKMTSKRSLEISKRYPGLVFSAVGIHPSYSDQSKPEDIETIVLTNNDSVVAIGEIGLDYYRNYSPRDIQLTTFKAMVSIAHRHNLPICLHNRDAEEDLLEILSMWYPPITHSTFPTGVFHAFDGSETIADWGIRHGFYFGIGGMVTHKNNTNLQERLCEIGLNNIVLETDSPYLTPVPFRGERNFPGNLHIIIEALSGLLKVDKEVVIKKTDENACRLFGLNKKTNKRLLMI